MNRCCGFLLLVLSSLVAMAPGVAVAHCLDSEYWGSGHPAIKVRLHDENADSLFAGLSAAEVGRAAARAIDNINENGLAEIDSSGTAWSRRRQTTGTVSSRLSKEATPAAPDRTGCWVKVTWGGLYIDGRVKVNSDKTWGFSPDVRQRSRRSGHSRIVHARARAQSRAPALRHWWRLPRRHGQGSRVVLRDTAVHRAAISCTRRHRGTVGALWTANRHRRPPRVDRRHNLVGWDASARCIDLRSAELGLKRDGSRRPRLDWLAPPSCGLVRPRPVPV